MSIPRLISLFFLASGLYLLGADVANLITGAHPSPQSAHSLWDQLDPGSLNAFESFVEGHLGILMWDPTMTTLLQMPAWTLPLIIGVLVLVADMAAQRRSRPR